MSPSMQPDGIPSRSSHRKNEDESAPFLAFIDNDSLVALESSNLDSPLEPFPRISTPNSLLSDDSAWLHPHPSTHPSHTRSESHPVVTLARDCASVPATHDPHLRSHGCRWAIGVSHA